MFPFAVPGFNPSVAVRYEDRLLKHVTVDNRQRKHVTLQPPPGVTSRTEEGGNFAYGAGREIGQACIWHARSLFAAGQRLRYLQRELIPLRMLPERLVYVRTVATPPLLAAAPAKFDKFAMLAGFGLALLVGYLFMGTTPAATNLNVASAPTIMSGVATRVQSVLPSFGGAVGSGI